jgi:four helix bundle protein
MGRIRSYRDLLIWQRGIELAKLVYKTTRGLPDDERFGLTTQLRRAAVSVPSNIAEGQARQSTREFRHYLHIALGSLAEVDTQVVLAIGLGYMQKETGRIIFGLIIELQKMIHSLIRKLPK